MKALRYNFDPAVLKRMMEEYHTIGYQAEIVDDELIVYYGKQVRKTKKQVAAEKAERWSKRERNFGYTRGQ